MKISFLRPWNEYDVGDELDVHPVVATWLVEHGIAGCRQGADTVKSEELFNIALTRRREL